MKFYTRDAEGSKYPKIFYINLLMNMFIIFTIHILRRNKVETSGGRHAFQIKSLLFDKNALKCGESIHDLPFHFRNVISVLRRQMAVPSGFCLLSAALEIFFKSINNST
jgi:hypothetical protein